MLYIIVLMTNESQSKYVLGRKGSVGVRTSKIRLRSWNVRLAVDKFMA